MKVRCVKLTDVYGLPQRQSPWLTVGKVYDVLSLEQSSDQEWLLRIVGDGLNGVALFQAREFEIVTATIPQNWIISWRSDLLGLMPKPWSSSGFWERYYDGDEKAVRIFDEERAKVIGQL